MITMYFALFWFDNTHVGFVMFELSFTHNETNTKTETHIQPQMEQQLTHTKR